ncbi:MAG: YdcF family protein [Bradyrhizobiaceae bacterium]|nr:YdcF family protein [Bradyrhizobiaceae bacterium]
MAGRKSRRYWLVLILSVVLFLVLIPLGATVYVDLATNTMMFDAQSAPKQRVALVLGTSRRTTKREMNGYYAERMRTAAELYASGKVQYLLVSGDNGTLEYNEPDSMRRDLVAMGVPPHRIATDFAGFDTYDSMIRAHKVWGVDSLIVVSQDFQARRAVYIASFNNIHAVGVAARDPHQNPFAMTRLREVFARLKMLADVHVLHSEPRFLGPHESFPADTTINSPDSTLPSTQTL